MKKKDFFYFFMFLLFSFIFSFSLKANENQEIMKSANEAYLAKQYKDAIELYQKIIANGNEGAILYYNLGNAYYKNNEAANALLWYERALRLAPTNQDIQHNIAFVNQKIIDKIEVLPTLFLTRWWNSLSHSMTSRGWAITSIVFSTLLALFIVGILFFQKKWLRSLSLFLSFFVTLFLIFSIIFANIEKNRFTNSPEAIVMESVVNVKSTPDKTSNDLFVIHEGLKVEVTDKLQDWVEIKIPNGEKGWVLSNSIAII